MKTLERTCQEWETEIDVSKFAAHAKVAMRVLGALYTLIAEVKLIPVLGDEGKPVAPRKRAVEDELSRVAKFSKAFSSKIRAAMLAGISNECDSLLTAA